MKELEMILGKRIHNMKLLEVIDLIAEIENK